MKCTVCVLLIASSVLVPALGCGGAAAPKLDPEIAKQRREAYEAKMRDGPPRGGQSGKRK